MKKGFLRNAEWGILICSIILLLIGFGVKLPIIPLHTWLPDAHTNAPTPVSMLLAGILLKTGAYGIFKINYEILKESFIIIAPILAIFALINILYITKCYEKLDGIDKYINISIFSI